MVISRKTLQTIMASLDTLKADSLGQLVRRAAESFGTNDVSDEQVLEFVREQSMGGQTDMFSGKSKLNYADIAESEITKRHK